MRCLEPKIITAGCKLPLLNLRPVVFTNGCFDLLHSGHVSFLQCARHLGRCLIVGLNDDQSVRQLKGAHRPINGWVDRVWVLAAVESVDWIFPMCSLTNVDLLELLKPDIWVKGGDYTLSTLNQDEVATAKKLGINIRFVPIERKISTTQIVDRMLKNA